MIRRSVLIPVLRNTNPRTTAAVGAVVSNMITASSSALSSSMTVPRSFSVSHTNHIRLQYGARPHNFMWSIITPQQPQQRWLSSSGTDATSASSSSASSSSEDPTSTTNFNSSPEEPSPGTTDDPFDNDTTTDPLDDVDSTESDEEPVVIKQEDATIVAARKQSQQMREMKDALLRSLAEQENTRTIAKRDVEQARQFAIKSLAKSLLDVADNLQRALDAVPKEYRPVTASSTTEVVPTATTEPLAINPDIFKTLYEGIEMTEKGLKKALEGHGVIQYGTVGDIFDPNKHEALMEYNDDTKMNNTIGIVMKCGYTLHSRVLRPAEVGVVKSTVTTTTAE